MLGTIGIFAFLFWNIYCFLLMLADKQKAVHGWGRIPEKRLIGYGFMLGGFGIAFGMMAFSHKVSKPEFWFKVIMSIIANIMCIVILLVLYL